MFACQAQVVLHHKDGWTSSRQVPTFYLSPSHYWDKEEANRAACAIVDPFNILEVHMSVEEI